MVEHPIVATGHRATQIRFTPSRTSPLAGKGLPPHLFGPLAFDLMWAFRPLPLVHQHLNRSGVSRVGKPFVSAFLAKNLIRMGAETLEAQPETMCPSKLMTGKVLTVDIEVSGK